MYGYDAGVLGGVQTTEPFLKAMGVRQKLFETLHSLTRTFSTQLEPMSFP